MATHKTTETRTHMASQFFNENASFSAVYHEMSKALQEVGIEVTIETSDDNLSRTYIRTMTEDKIPLYKSIYEQYLNQSANVAIEKHEGFYQYQINTLPRSWDSERSYKIFTGEITL